MIMLSKEGMPKAEMGRKLDFFNQTANQAVKFKKNIYIYTHTYTYEIKSSTPVNTQMITKYNGHTVGK